MLFTLVEPHRGHEVAYNRWYERDHFYAGCMIGACIFAGRRWVATRPLQGPALPGDAPIAPDPLTGSYLALYWVLDGHHQDVEPLGLPSRSSNSTRTAGCSPQRDHVHTLLYTTRLGRRTATPTRCPPALALDHPFGDSSVVIGEATEDRARELDAWLPRRAPARAACRAPRPRCAWRSPPIPLLVDAPGVTPRTRAATRRFLPPRTSSTTTRSASGTRDGFARHDAALADAGSGRVLWARRSSRRSPAPTPTPTSSGSPRGPARTRAEEAAVPRRAARVARARSLPTLPPEPDRDDWDGRRAYDTAWQRDAVRRRLRRHRLAGGGRRARRVARPST